MRPRDEWSAAAMSAAKKPQAVSDPRLVWLERTISSALRLRSERFRKFAQNADNLCGRAAP